jgi:hypothetical protein
LPKNEHAINSKFELLGIWYLPESPTSKIPGTLTYDYGNINLETLGEVGHPERIDFIQSLQSMKDDNSIPIIFGLSTTGEKITLVDSSRINLHQTMNGLTTAKYISSSLYIGEEFTDKNQILFDSVSMSYSNLKKWHLNSGINFDVSNIIDKKFQINLSQVEMITAKINDDFDLTISLSAEIDKENYENIVKIEETPIISIKCREKKQVKEFLEIHRCYRYFLMLGMMNNVFPLRIKGNIGDKNIEIFPNICVSRDIPTISSPDKMLFTYPMISKNFMQIILDWWCLWTNFKDILTKYFSTLSNSTLISGELQFQSLAMILESIHRKKFHNEEDPEYESMINNMKEKLKENKKQVKFVDRFSSMGNSPSLQAKILKLIEISPESFKDVENEKCKFSEDVMHTRNYYSHGYDSLKDKATTTQPELYYLNQQLKLLIEGILLRELSFSNDFILNIMKKNKQIRNYAKEHPYS